MEIDSLPANNALNRTDFIQRQKEKNGQFGQPSFGAKFLSVTSAQEPHKKRKKFKPLMPKLSERSKVIGKGLNYNDKFDKRKGEKIYAGPSAGGNRLNQKHKKEKFKVSGMALTKQQKKQLLKK